jgi:coenzyme Q-binding protein COQ10
MPTHAEKRVVAYTPAQMFDLVADVGRYPEFLPWCVAAKIREQSESELVADLTIGFKVFRETFTSRVKLDPPANDGTGMVHVAYENGPFRYLNNHWKFLPHERGCLVDFYVDFEFRSRILQLAIGVVFNEATRLMVNAFLRRARSVYGPPRPVPVAGAPEKLQPG